MGQEMHREQEANKAQEMHREQEAHKAQEMDRGNTGDRWSSFCFWGLCSEPCYMGTVFRQRRSFMAWFYASA